MAEPTQTLKEIDQEIAKFKECATSIIASEKRGRVPDETTGPASRDPECPAVPRPWRLILSPRSFP
jgi:hypothetical protein